LTLIIEEAVKTRTSDIHLEPEENRLRVRYRIDGILHEMMSLPLSINRALISRIKILSDMNIADHMRPRTVNSRSMPKAVWLISALPLFPVSTVKWPCCVSLINHGPAAAWRRLAFYPPV